MEYGYDASKRDNKFLDIAILLAFIVVVYAIVEEASGIKTQQDKFNDRINGLKITRIGGCDKYGSCGVMLEDGTFLKNYPMPVIGMKVSEGTPY